MNVPGSLDQAFVKCGSVVRETALSGWSANTIPGLCQPKKMKLSIAVLDDRDGGGLAGLANPLLPALSSTTARTQEMHVTLGQMLCGALETELGLA